MLAWHEFKMDVAFWFRRLLSYLGELLFRFTAGFTLSTLLVFPHPELAMVRLFPCFLPFHPLHVFSVIFCTRPNTLALFGYQFPPHDA